MFSEVGRVRRTRFKSLIRNMARWGCGAFEVSHTAVAEFGVEGCARDASTGWAVGGRDAVGGCGSGNAQAVVSGSVYRWAGRRDKPGRRRLRPCRAALRARRAGGR